MTKSIFVLLLLFSFFVKAQTADVTCWDKNCLKNGWTWKSNFSSVDYACYREGCDISGWIVGTPDKPYTQCKLGGCFNEGWYQLDMISQTLSRDVVCGIRGPEQSCSKYGWTAYSRQSGQLFTVICRDLDCFNKGWFVRFIDGRTTHVVCKTDGCFVNGWREY